MDVTRSVASPSDDIKKAAVFEKDALLSAQTMIYDDGEMKKTLPSDVYERFKTALVDGAGQCRVDGVRQVSRRWRRTPAADVDHGLRGEQRILLEDRGLLDVFARRSDGARDVHDADWCSLGMAPLARLVMSVERRRGAAYRIGAGTLRSTCCGTEAASCARVGTAILFSTPRRAQKWRRLRVKQPSAKK